MNKDEQLNVLVIPQPRVYNGKTAGAFLPVGSFRDPKTAELLKRLTDCALQGATQLRGDQKHHLCA